MSVINMLFTVLSCSFVHMIIVEYLSTRNIKPSGKTRFEFFAALFVIFLSGHVISRESCVYYPLIMFIPPLCAFYINRLSIPEAFALSAAGDIIILSGEITAYVTGIKPEMFLHCLVKNLATLLIAVLVTAAVLTVKKRLPYSKFENNIGFYFLLFLFMSILLNFYMTVLINDYPLVTYLANFCYKALIFMLLVYIHTLNAKTRYEQKSRDLARLVKYTRRLENVCDDLTGLKHNYSNILLSINGYLCEKRFDELRDYLSNHVLKDYCKSLNSNFLPSLKHVRNPALKGIIFSKLNQAAMKNIKLFINIFSRIEINNIDPADLVKIIGILFDNAIEACENSSGNELHLGMDSDSSHTSILIGNTYCRLPDLSRICERGYSTKGDNRGFGLYYLKKILSFYPHAQLKTTVNDNIFFQELIIIK